MVLGMASFCSIRPGRLETYRALLSCVVSAIRAKLEGPSTAGTESVESPPHIRPAKVLQHCSSLEARCSLQLGQVARGLENEHIGRCSLIGMDGSRIRTDGTVMSLFQLAKAIRAAPRSGPQDKQLQFQDGAGSAGREADTDSDSDSQESDGKSHSESAPIATTGMLRLVLLRWEGGISLARQLAN